MLKKNFVSGSVLQNSLDWLSVVVPTELVSKLISFFITKKKWDLLMHGFEKGRIPEAYIKEHFKASLLAHAEKILFYFYAQDIFIKSLAAKGVYIPKIFSFEKEINLATFAVRFTYQQTSHLLDSEKTYFDEGKKVKFPERKKYKDLDRQASLTFAQEQQNKENTKVLIVEEGDWISIKVQLIDDKGEIIDERLSLKLWVYITSEGIDREIRATFLGKKKGEQFSVRAFFLEELLSTDFLDHTFLVTIQDHISHLYFDFAQFEEAYGFHGQDVIEKMIEVFSLRNDISLKKEKSQLVLKHFLEKIKISLDQETIFEHECMIKNRIVKNADYLLYQSDTNFLSNIKKLACRQAMEKILIDYLIYKYKIKTEYPPIYAYLNVLQRHRLKDFLYFDTANLYDSTMKFIPIFDYTITQMSLREKAVEYLIAKLS